MLNRIQNALKVKFSEDRQYVTESIDDSMEIIKRNNEALEEYKEFRAIMRQLHTMNREDIHKTYEFINSLYNAKRKR